jgi:hypothetical protein
MWTEVRPAARSTPEAPLYLWRVWHESRPVAMGITPSREEAERMAAHCAVDRGASRPDPSPWLEQFLEESMTANTSATGRPHGELRK